MSKLLPKVALTLPWVAGFAGAGIATYFIWRNWFATKMGLPADVSGPQGQDIGGVILVQNAERAYGSDARLLNFLTWWRTNGPFQILVAPDGGVRKSQALQKNFFERGLTKAKTLEETPHGRGGAIDVWPVGFDPSKDFSTQPVMKKRFEEIGRIAKEKFDLVWGGDWGWDYPHLEVKGWRALPFNGPKALAGLGDAVDTVPEAFDTTNTQFLGGTAAQVTLGLIGAALVYQVFVRKDEGPRSIRLGVGDERLQKLKAG